MKNLSYITLLAFSLVYSYSVLADITVMSHGGSNKDAQVKAFYEPWSQKTGIKIIAGEFSGELSRLKVMVDTGSVFWDVAELESAERMRACEEGLLEDYSTAPSIIALKDHLMPEAIQPCAIGFFVWSTVLTYNADLLKTAPTGWVDFWDLQEFPGKRGMRKIAKYTLEFALLADGVKHEDIYPVLATKEGQNRAFAKLDEIKEHIQWWEAGAHAIQYLAAGDVVMSPAYNGRVAAVQNETNLQMVWNGGIYDMDFFVIPRGAKNITQGIDFITFVLQSAAQKNFAEQIAYGPVNLEAALQIDEKLLSNMPTHAPNLKQQIILNTTFWADHQEELEQRFNAWAAR